MEYFFATRLLKEFCNKLEKNKKKILNNFLQKLKATGSIKLTTGGGQLLCVAFSY